jgi:lipid-A-disaccharide synthase
LGSSKVALFEGGTQALLRMADAALVTSGTATLETALFGVPQVVCYRGNALSVMLARKLIKVNYISLANLILNREAVTELIQSDLTASNLRHHLSAAISASGKQKAQLLRNELWDKLGGPGASANAARIVVDALR